MRRIWDGVSVAGTAAAAEPGPVRADRRVRCARWRASPSASSATRSPAGPAASPWSPRCHDGRAGGHDGRVVLVAVARPAAGAGVHRPLGLLARGPRRRRRASRSTSSAPSRTTCRRCSRSRAPTSSRASPTSAAPTTCRCCRSASRGWSARPTRRCEGGDHTILIGRVVQHRARGHRPAGLLQPHLRPAHPGGHRRHLMVQPTAGVSAVAGASPPSTASRASRSQASRTPPASRLSSIAPWYRMRRSPSRT